MNFPVLALAFCGFLGGTLVISRTLRCAIGLREVPPPSAVADGRTIHRPWPVVVFLHSGPWVLALAIGAVWYVASLSRPELLWALVGGLGVAVAIIVGVAVAGSASTQRQPAPPVPLTPERLARKRREFFLLTIAFWSITQTAGMAMMYWATLDRDYVIVILTALCSPLGGWMFAWVMWQWIGTSLEVAEKKRRQRAERERRA